MNKQDEANTTPLTSEQMVYIEKVGAFCYTFGTPLSMGRVLGLLLICRPVHQSADEIREKLHMSVGGVSTAVSALQRAGLVERVTFPEDRRYYYQLDSKGWERSLQYRLNALVSAKDLAADGLKIDPENQRLVDMLQFYEWCGGAFTEVFSAFKQHNKKVEAN